MVAEVAAGPRIPVPVQVRAQVRAEVVGVGDSPLGVEEEPEGRAMKACFN